MTKERQALKNEGYFVDNLWHVNDVCDRFACTDEQAHKVLSKVLESEYIMANIHQAIRDVAQIDFNLKFK